MKYIVYLEYLLLTDTAPPINSGISAES